MKTSLAITLCLAGVAACALQASARTMSVTAVNDGTVSLVFGEPDGKGYSLCLAYGATDGGSDKYAWDSFTRGVASVAADQTSGTFAIPSELVSANAWFRLFLMQTSDLPYQQELTYIESTQDGDKTQYVKTGVMGNAGIRVESDLAVMESADTTMIGSRTSDGVRFYPIHVNSHDKWSMGYNWFHAGSVNVTVGQKVHAVAEMMGGLQSLTIDGVLSYSNTEGAYDTDLEMYVFACNLNGEAQLKSKTRIYNLQIYEDGRMVRSFIPVKRNTGWGGFCDQVTGGDFGNAGNGSFTMSAVPNDEENRRGLVKATTVSLRANMSLVSREVLSTMPWQQNVYTNRFTIMCEAKERTDGLQLQYGEGYAQTAEMTGETTTAGTLVYKARVTVGGREGAEIPYRIARFGLPLTGTGADSAAGSVRLWRQDENDFTCSVWGDNQEGARPYDWDCDRFQYLRAIFSHMLERNVAFGVCTGDMSTNADYEREIRPCDLLITDEIFGCVRPYYVAWGNHDTWHAENKPFFETPGIDDPGYRSSFRGNSYLYRGNTLFILIDDDLHANEGSKAWLENLLATPRAKAAAFRLVFHHLPIYTEVSSSESRYLNQTFIDGKVDVVFGGHMHGYERFIKDGIVYIINGCAGYLDHNITHKRNYGDDSLVGGHISLPYLWARQESCTVNDVLGPSDPARMGMVAGYAELTVRNNRLLYRQHAFNADGSYIGVCDSFRLDSSTAAPAPETPATDPVCPNPERFAEFTRKPVTNERWKEFADAVGVGFSFAEGKGASAVVNVSKNDIVRFLAWLNGANGSYRLPSVTELETAFGGELRREVSEMTSTVEPASGWCRILGAPAKARKGVYERAADRPALMTADCHADYVGFRLTTDAPPPESEDPFAAALAALAALANPAEVYKWENDALVDVSAEWDSPSSDTLAYRVPVIFTRAGALSFDQPKGVELAGGCAMPNASSFAVTGPLAIGKRLAFGRISGTGAEELTGFVLSGGTLTLKDVASVGSCVQFRSADRALRLAGTNDFTSAALSFGAESVTNLMTAVPGSAAALRARSARQYCHDDSYSLVFGKDLSVTITEEFQCGQANYWINGVLDTATVSMPITNNRPSFWGSGTLVTGELAFFKTSEMRFGVSNLVISSARPIRTNMSGGGHNRFEIEGDGVRLRMTEDWVLPRFDQWQAVVVLSTANSCTAKPRLIVDTLDPDGKTPHTVTFEPYRAENASWGITKENPGTLVLNGNFQQTLTTQVKGGELRLTDGTEHRNAPIEVADGGTLTLEGSVSVANVSFTGGLLNLGSSVTFSGALYGAHAVAQAAKGVLTVAVGTTMEGALTLAPGTTKLKVKVTGVTEPGDYLVFAKCGLAKGQVKFTTDGGLSATAVTGEGGDILMRVYPHPETCHWTGAVDSDLANPQNWVTTNHYGEAVQAAPSDTATVYFRGTCSATVRPGTRLPVEKIVCADVHLAADCDWRALGPAEFEGRLDLNGHRLRVAGLSGAGVITDRPLAADGYEPLEWVASDGTNYAMTDVIGSTGISADADVMCLPESECVFWQEDACVVGSRKGDLRFLLIWNVKTACGMGYDKFIGGAVSGGSEYGSFELGVRYVIASHMCDGRQTMYMDGVQKCFASRSGTYDTQLPLWIFACNLDGVTAGWPITARLYALRLYRDGTLVGDYVPARRMADGEAGFYDKVLGKFIERQGTNPFRQGPKVTAAPGVAGELWIDVAAGTLNVNAGVSVAGGVKLVKAGGGVYETDVSMQTYTGGTRLAGGSFILGITPVGDEMPLGVAAPEVLVDIEERRSWGDMRAFAWQTCPTSTTFTLTQRMKDCGYRLTRRHDGVLLRRGSLLLFR